MDDLNGVIRQVIQVSPIMKVFRVAPIGWELPDFKPGQFVGIGLPPDSARCPEATDETEVPDPTKIIKRAYSIASSNFAKDYLEFYITLVHSGALTPRLFNLEIGDKVWVGTKFTGMFTLSEVPEDQNIILIATGTGVAPYMSMLRSHALKRQGQILVIHGAASSWDLGYSSELNLLETIAPKFDYLPTITNPEREHSKWPGRTQFIQEIWEEGAVEKLWKFKPTPENTHFFLCGNPNMINGMIECLGKDGFVEHNRRTGGHIHVEKF
ncbi:MAG: ferredoxin--NADP reductase [Bacteroidales bacterium]|nr:ferredoxin--NADP reductase [Bacteroidales bacterium]